MERRNRGSWRVVVFGAVVAVLVVAACSSSNPEPAATTRDPSIVVVGTFDFPESELMGELFVQALRAAGITAERQFRIGSREVVEPALEQGLIDVVPEYLASATQFLTLGEDPVDRAAVVHERLRKVAATRGLTPLPASAAVDRNAIAMRADVAERLGIASVEDLRAERDLDFVGPPECPERPACLPLLTSLGVEFDSFTPLPPGEPIALALAAGEVHVGLMFSTDPLIQRHGLVLLDGQVGFDRAEQLVPLVRTVVVERHGDRLVGALDRVTSRLTTEELTTLNGLVLDGEPVEEVAARWLGV